MACSTLSTAVDYLRPMPDKVLTQLQASSDTVLRHVVEYIVHTLYKYLSRSASCTSCLELSGIMALQHDTMDRGVLH